MNRIFEEKKKKKIPSNSLNFLYRSYDDFFYGLKALTVNFYFWVGEKYKFDKLIDRILFM